MITVLYFAGIKEQLGLARESVELPAGVRHVGTLAATLRAVVSQRLVRRCDAEGRVPAVEVMINTAYIRECILVPEKTRAVRDAISAGTSQYGMQTFDQSLWDLFQAGLINYETALENASNADDFKLRMQGISSTSDASRNAMQTAGYGGR